VENLQKSIASILSILL